MGEAGVAWAILGVNKLLMALHSRERTGWAIQVARQQEGVATGKAIKEALSLDDLQGFP